MIPVLILVSIFSFMIIHFAPGDPLNMYIRPDMTQQEINELRVDLGLDGTIVEQYFAWLKNVCKGNFGNSLINHQPVASQIFSKLPATILLMGTSFVLSVLVAIPLGLWSGMKKNKMTDQVISILAYIGISIPAFWLGLMLIIVFALNLHWLPSELWKFRFKLRTEIRALQIVDRAHKALSLSIRSQTTSFCS